MINMSNPTAFISYAWENTETQKWVKDLAAKLRADSIDVKLDQWEVVPGDQLPHFMEKSVRENDFVLIICTPKYKEKSEKRSGGVGYEGDVMSAEVLQTSNHRKFIPILKSGTKDTAIPSWLIGKYYIDLSDEEKYNGNYSDLKATLLNFRESAPPLGKIRPTSNLSASTPSKQDEEATIKIKGILVNEVTEPRNDGTLGSNLYRIPFDLNQTPSAEWARFFIDAWNRPSRFTSMHRPGIASVRGNKIILDGTTIEEVEKYHKDTLKLAVQSANQKLSEILLKRKELAEQKAKQRDQHRKNIGDINDRINFD
ncbi:MAG: toll/interleukin-1 receptor domain-containing protein [Leptospiraceae bacterium]|nr:toll/interleukin-1 receptor domain-containing protein [Leptospiraceae bacterium]